ncbi:MAG: Uma2 family endonuclease [bacterium]|nr:Uma2 family endonuclease [bacterium]
MGLAAKKELERYTYQDYLSWDDDQNWEIINGKAHKLHGMSPAPTRVHQAVFRELFLQLGHQLKNNSCHLYSAPFDVRLHEEDQVEEECTNIVQPDIAIICDVEKLDEKGCKGAPDFIIEILSPATSRRDKLEKFNLYEEAGVKEYWLVSPEENIAEVFILGPDKRYGRPFRYTEKDTAPVKVIKGLTIDFSPVFAESLAEVP